MRADVLLLSSAILLAGCARSGPQADLLNLEEQVRATERAFARTMADRDHAAFTTFLSDEAVFASGDETLRGKEQVAASWKQYFDEDGAPFSWTPETVEVLESGSLALSTGPVHDSGGKLIATFTSIWRQEAPDRWYVVFDKGHPACASPQP